MEGSRKLSSFINIVAEDGGRVEGGVGGVDIGRVFWDGILFVYQKDWVFG